jgi:hypothetical protein
MEKLKLKREGKASRVITRCEIKGESRVITGLFSIELNSNFLHVTSTDYSNMSPGVIEHVGNKSPEIPLEAALMTALHKVRYFDKEAAIAELEAAIAQKDEIISLLISKTTEKHYE